MEQKIRTTTTYRAVNISELEDEDIRSHEYLFQVNRFDQNGNLLEDTSYTSDGSISHKSVYAYDDQGRMTEEMLVEEDDFMSEHRTLEYDEKGRLAREVFHYLDGSYDETAHNYDEENRLRSKVMVSDEGEDGNRVELEYEGKNLVSEKEFTAEGEEVTSRIFAYDSKGNLLSEEYRSVDEEFLVEHEYDEAGARKSTRKYDADGHLVERSTFTRNETGMIIAIREESRSGVELIQMEFDPDGNTLLQLTTSESGEMVSKVTRNYDNKLLQTTEVFIEGSGQRIPQHYRLRFEYEMY